MAKKTISNTFTVNTVEDGDDSVVYKIDFGNSVFSYDPNTNRNTIFINGTVYKVVGNDTLVFTQLASSMLSLAFYDANGALVRNVSSADVGVENGTFITRSGNASTPSSPNAEESLLATITIDGVQVARNGLQIFKDGKSAPFYNEEWYAWSNVASTANTTTSPFTEPYSGWQRYIPEQGSMAYLWKKIVRWNYNTSTKAYIDSSPQYFRMSGTNGTSIHTRGEVANASSRGNGYADIITDSGTLRITLSDGDAVTQLDNGHLYQWVTEGGSKWLDLGQFKGESGVTYYTHIAWATNVVLSQSSLPKPAGQQNIPNATSVSGGAIVPSGADLPWMGYLIDTNVSDSTTFTNYTWSKTKGAKGEDAVAYEIQTSVENVKIPSNETSVSKSITFRFYSKTGDADKQAFTTYYTIYYRSINNAYTWVYPPTSYARSSYTYTFSNIGTSVNTIVVYVWGNTDYRGQFPEGQTYLAKKEIPILKDGDTGEQGERGKVGRFYYYSGFDWDASNENDTFVVNDAQVPYFSKAGSKGDKYYVFNPETTPASGEMTMADMAAETTVDRQIQWNSAPWEVMTDDFKYLITQALFGAYAHLGSWIFNSDYMLSEKDKNGVPRGQRAYNGMGDSQLTTGFIPSIAFDALNGRASFGGDTVRFQPDGAGWLANKSIIWDADGNASFSGFIKKTPTYITPENESEYIINYFSTLYTFDIQKTGTFVILQNGVQPTSFDFPCLYQYVSQRYTNEQKMIIRSYVGTKFLLYNSSGHGLSITYMYDSNGDNYSDWLGNGSCATLECKIREESGYENVYWEVIHCGSIL